MSKYCMHKASLFDKEVNLLYVRKLTDYNHTKQKNCSACTDKIRKPAQESLLRCHVYIKFQAPPLNVWWWWWGYISVF